MSYRITFNSQTPRKQGTSNPSVYWCDVAPASISLSCLMYNLLVYQLLREAAWIDHRQQTSINLPDCNILTSSLHALFTGLCSLD